MKKYFNIFKIKRFFFCDKIRRERIDFTALKSLSSDLEYRNFYEMNKNNFEGDIESKLLFLDYYSSYINETGLKSSFSQSILSNIEEHIPNLEKFHLLSLIESLQKLDFYDENKIWIRIEHILLSTSFLKTIPITYFSLILKAIQPFFSIKNTTISAEEIFETIEYNLILKLKEESKSNEGNLKLENNKITQIVELFVLFAKNLEGSKELYSMLIEKFFTSEDLLTIFKNNQEYLINMYISTVILIENVDKKCKILNKLLSDIELIFSTQSLKTQQLSDLLPILHWALEKRNLKLL
jgi:hypothetical protein